MAGTSLRDSYHGRRILVTGNTGFTGNWISNWLGLLDSEAIGVSKDRPGLGNLFSQSELDAVLPTRFFHIEDVDQTEALVRDFQPELIIHLAAQALVSEGFRDPLNTYATNVMGTASILNAALTVEAVRGIVIITTDKVYQDSMYPHLEDSRLGGSDPYSGSKVAAESVVTGYRPLLEAQGKIVSVIRGGNIFGGGDWSTNRLVPDLFRAWWDERALNVRNPTATRPWQHVLDLCHAYLLVGAKILLGNKSVDEEFNVGPKPTESMAVLEFLSLFRETQVPIKYQSAGFTESLNLNLDSTKIERILGWYPALQMPDAVRMTEEWFHAVLPQEAQPGEITRKQIVDYSTLRNEKEGLP